MPRPSTSFKPKPSSPRKRAREPSIDSTPSLEPSPLGLDKSLVLQIIIAKLESSKTCDWFALSQSLGSYSTPEQAIKRAKGKKAKAAGDGGGGMSGTEIHDLYHNVILPALKSGRALWVDDATANDMEVKQATPVREEEQGPTTPPEEEGEDDDVVIAEQEEDEEEEGDGMLLEELEQLEKGTKKPNNRRKPASKKQTYGGEAKRARTAKGGTKKYTETLQSDEEVGGGAEEYETVSDDE